MVTIRQATQLELDAVRSFYQQVGFQEIEPLAAPLALCERFEQYQARGMGVILMN